MLSKPGNKLHGSSLPPIALSRLLFTALTSLVLLMQASTLVAQSLYLSCLFLFLPVLVQILCCDHGGLLIGSTSLAVWLMTPDALWALPLDGLCQGHWVSGPDSENHQFLLPLLCISILIRDCPAIISIKKLSRILWAIPSILLDCMNSAPR